jgi:hypothetical protein
VYAKTTGGERAPQIAYLRSSRNGAGVAREARRVDSGRTARWGDGGAARRATRQQGGLGAADGGARRGGRQGGGAGRARREFGGWRRRRCRVGPAAGWRQAEAASVGAEAAERGGWGGGGRKKRLWLASHRFVKLNIPSLLEKKTVSKFLNS